MLKNKKSESVLAASFLPAAAVLEMTFECNHECLFCSCPWEAPGESFCREKELSIEEWKKTLTQLTRMGVSNFAFTGGEPLLKEGILDLIEFAAGLKVYYTETYQGQLKTTLVPPALFLLSNGRNMSQEVLNLCLKHQIHLSMSLPGLSSYQKHIGGKDTEAGNILFWIKEAQKKGIAVTANITATRLNIHELYETIANALIAGASNILLNRFLYGGRGIDHAEELTLSREEIVFMLDTAEEVLSASERYGSIGTEIPLCLIPKPEKYSHLQISTRCSAARDFFVVSPDGYIRTCNHSPVKLSHISNIETLKDHPYWKQFVFNDYLPKMCLSCANTDRCDGGCREAAHILNGSVKANDPVFSSYELSGKA